MGGHINWAVWRVILAGIATLEEIERHWSINDLADANDALDIRDELQISEYEKQKKAIRQ